MIYLHQYKYPDGLFSVQEIQGNTNPDGTALKMLQYQVIARHVRFVAIEWVENICMRVEIYGCEGMLMYRYFRLP